MCWRSVHFKLKFKSLEFTYLKIQRKKVKSMEIIFTLKLLFLHFAVLLFTFSIRKTQSAFFHPSQDAGKVPFNKCAILVRLFELSGEGG